MAINVLHGFEQELLAGIEDGNLIISNLLVKDYPVILRLIDLLWSSSNSLPY